MWELGVVLLPPQKGWWEVTSQPDHSHFKLCTSCPLLTFSPCPLLSCAHPCYSDFDIESNQALKCNSQLTLTHCSPFPVSAQRVWTHIVQSVHTSKVKRAKELSATFCHSLPPWRLKPPEGPLSLPVWLHEQGLINSHGNKFQPQVVHCSDTNPPEVFVIIFLWNTSVPTLRVNVRMKTYCWAKDENVLIRKKHYRNVLFS